MKFVAFSSIPTVLRSRWGRPPSFHALATTKREVHPPEETYSPPAIYLDDDDVMRIRSAAEFVSEREAVKDLLGPAA